MRLRTPVATEEPSRPSAINVTHRTRRRPVRILLLPGSSENLLTARHSIPARSLREAVLRSNGRPGFLQLSPRQRGAQFSPVL